MIWNVVDYISDLVARNAMARECGYKLRRVTGLSGLEELLGSGDGNCVAVDVTSDGQVRQTFGGGFYQKRIYTVFVLSRYDYGRMESLSEALRQCRALFYQMLSALYRDSARLENEHLIYLNSSNITYKELSPDIAEHYAGLYFMLEFDEPLELVYDEGQWI